MSGLPTPAQIADYIEENGHCRGTYYNIDGSVCVLGAFQLLIEDESLWEDDYWEDIGLVEMAADAGFSRYETPHLNVIKWSDNTETDKLLAQLRGQT